MPEQITIFDHLEGRITTLACSPRRLLGLLYDPELSWPQRYEGLRELGVEQSRAVAILYNRDFLIDVNAEGDRVAIMVQEPYLFNSEGAVVAASHARIAVCPKQRDLVESFFGEHSWTYCSRLTVEAALEAGLDVEWAWECGIIPRNKTTQHAFHHNNLDVAL